MPLYRLALIGFGNVGQGLARILHDRGADLARQFDARFAVVAICDQHKGSVVDPAGLDLGAALRAIEARGTLAELAAPGRQADALSMIRETSADVIVEASWTDLRTGEPALSYIRTALELGKHVVTSNKGPVALHYPLLARLAQQQGVELGVEGTVMSGTPSLRLGRELLAAAGITRLQGILNGTTNYMLTRMEAGASYAEALAQAQARGYAEADPTGDVEGYDAAGKLVILANLLLGLPLSMADVQRQGITGLTVDDITAARSAGERWKLIGSVERRGSGFSASVRPTRLPAEHPLAGVSGATNALSYSTELLGEVTLVGPGAGPIETGYALLQDLLAIHRARRASQQ